MSSSSEWSGSPSHSASAGGSDSGSGSDSSDEFFDAEEPTGTLLRFSKKAFETPRQRVDLTTLTPAEIDSYSSSDVYFSPASANVSGSGTLLASHNASTASITSLPRTEKEQEEYEEEERRMKKMEEMRRRLNTEEIEELHPDETSPSDSQTSSIEGLYGATSGRTSHPFKVVDHDTVSMQSGVSVGRLGRISNNPPSMSSVSSNATSTSTNSSSMTSSAQTQSTILSATSQLQHSSGNTISEETEGASTNNATNNKPDLVASCLSKDKNREFNTDDNTFNKTPVAPPRRKRRGLLPTQSEESSAVNETTVKSGPSGDGSVEKDTTPEPLSSAQHRRTAAAVALNQKRSDSTSSVCSDTSSQNPPSPTVSIRSVCKDLDKTLDVTASQKFWVVKAQDEEKTRAKNSGPKVLRRTESLPKDVIAAFEPSGTGSGGVRDSTSNSSTLNTSLFVAEGQTSDAGSVPTTVSTATVTSLPITGHLSSMISAMAALEEQQDKESAESQLNITLRTRTDSGKLLSDMEILEQVTVLNLDTGERIPLSSAEDKIPQCINPLSLHIMRLTSEYVGDSMLLLHAIKDRDSDEESISSKKSSAASQEDGESSGLGVKKKTAQIRRFLGSTVKKTVDKAKSLAHHRHPKEDVDISTNEDLTVGGQDPLVKMKASHSHKGPYDFDHLQQVQDLMGEHNGPVWCMKFSNDGRLLATAGQDRIIRIWVLKDHLPYFQDMRSKHTVDKVSPTPSQESIVSQHSHHSVEEMMQACENSDPKAPFVPRPLCIYSGHTADLLDIAWSKSFFLLSSSMDRTVRLWHISRRECLCCFQHIDFVTAIAFHPRDDRYFLSGSLDGKLRLWNIPDKKVALWNEVNGPNNLITTANFCQNGKFAVVGTYDGRCIFFHTEQLKYHTQIIVHRRKRLTGRKITGIEPMPGEDKILVTSNDSRIRLYDLRDLSLTCKYKGYSNSSSQIKGTVSHDGKYIVSGSENQCVYIWKTCHDYSKFSSARRDRNGYWEGVKAHNAVVTCAIFAPDPDIIVKQIEAKEKEEQQKSATVKSPSLTKSQSQSHASACPLGYVLVSADFSGCIKVFLSKVKPKHSSLPASALA